MTRMIPSTIHSLVRSGAERRLFKVIQDAPQSDGWICLHSLGVARHETKRRAEIDFFLLTPFGLFVLEVKGGRVRREDGVWVHTDRYGAVSKKRESPFDQASSAMFAIERDIRSQFAGGRIADALFGYGVMFPDIRFDAVGSEADASIVFDVRDRGRSFTAYLQRVATFTRQRQPRPRFALSLAELVKVADFLRGDFDLVPAVTVTLGDTQEQLEQITLEQCEVLDAAENAPRLVVDGPAGSGKTVLAMEAARRDARLGKRVLWLCYNRLLAARVRGQLSKEQFSGSAVVRTIHSHFRDVIEKSSLADEFRERSAAETQERLFDVLYPEYAALAALESAEPPVESLVIDEAQDVLSEHNLEALSEMVEGGLSGGRWRLFLDANDQACVYGRMNPASLVRVRDLASRELLLTLNCRNTRPIALQTNVVADPERRAVGRIDGPPVEFSSYKTDREALSRLGQVLDGLRHEGMAKGHVSVLFPRAPDEQQVRRLISMGIRQLAEEDVASLESNSPKAFTWATVSSFKGLENDVVVLAGVKEIESDWWRAVTYVGMSRARYRLYVISHVDCDPIRQERFQQEISRRLGKGELGA